VRYSQLRVVFFIGVFLISVLLFVLWYLGWVSIVAALLLAMVLFISAFFVNMALKSAVEREQHTGPSHTGSTYRRM